MRISKKSITPWISLTIHYARNTQLYPHTHTTQRQNGYIGVHLRKYYIIKRLFRPFDEGTIICGIDNSSYL